MRSASIGTRAASPSRRDGDGTRAGFTLLEALVALALVLAFAAALGPHLFQARRIMVHSEGRVVAQVLLRTLLEAPFERSSLANASREGEVAGLRWRIVTAPIAIDAMSSGDRTRERSNWSAFRVTASVSWAPGQIITAETVRLGKPE
jgi:prepilin-type N-terminal cleavage/methylation domain-containing protein